ncbi:MAG: hypothetical protein ACLFMO_08355 [Eubacteriales bacterium]
MKKLIILLFLLISVSTTTSTSNRDPEVVRKEALLNYERMLYQQEVDRTKRMHAKELDNFLEHLAKRESSNNPTVINTYGYIGKYQFGRAALLDVGYTDVTTLKFRKDPTIFPEAEQDSAVVKLMKLNKERIGNLLDEYQGKTINGIEITEAGLLAAAHLAGAGGVKRFLKSGGKYNPSDGYSTKLTDYLKDFQHHKINVNYV